MYLALSLVVAKISPREEEGADLSMTLRIPVPNSAGGAIIGKAGAAIKELSDKSGAKVQLSKKDDMHPELQERLCALTGSTICILSAAKMVLEKVIEGNCTYSNMTTNYGSMGRGGMMGMGHMSGPMGYGAIPQMQMPQLMSTPHHQSHHQSHMGGSHHQNMGSSSHGSGQARGQDGQGDAPSTTVTMSVPDSSVGVVVGKVTTNPNPNRNPCKSKRL